MAKKRIDRERLLEQLYYMDRDDLEEVALRALSALAVDKAFRALAPFLEAEDIVPEEAGDTELRGG